MSVDESNSEIQSPLAQRDVQWTLIILGLGLLLVMVGRRTQNVPPPMHGVSSESRQRLTQIDAAAAPLPGVQIDINRAPSHELALLPRVGPVLAKRIVDDRIRNGEYDSVEDLQRVHGIGPKILIEITQICRVDSDPEKRRPERR